MKRTIIAWVVIVSLLLTALPFPAFAATPSEIESQITDAYAEALSRSGKSSFDGYCGDYVNWHLLVLGINDTNVAGHGKDQYDNYKNLTKSSGGYPITAYSANNYTLKSALNHITSFGTTDVFNILVGFQRTNSSPKYGHAFFIHAIIDGIVYYSESYDCTIDGTRYREGHVIACTIDQVATYYGYWATFEGIIHFGTVYPSEMTLTGLEMPEILAQGQTPGLKGSVEYHRTIEQIWVGVEARNTSEPITLAQCEPDSYTCDIAKLLSELDFAGLPTGAYTLKVIGTGDGREHLLYSRDFTVYPSKMTLTGTEMPDIIVEGSSPELKGSAAYYQPIDRMWVGVDASGTSDHIIQAQCEPGSYTCDITELLSELDFAGLESGDYTYRVEGSSGEEHYILYEKDFMVFAPSAEHPFADVQTDAFCYSPVLWAVENGITQGVTDITFGPSTACSRAQVVTFLWRAEGCPEPTVTEHDFADVQPGSYYEKAVLWAVEKGITTGTSATTFSPTSVCSRAQVVTFLHRTFGSPAAQNADGPFTDVPTGSWYEASIAWAVENGITNGLSATEFGPNSSCNRAQVVTFLYRAYNE